MASGGSKVIAFIGCSLQGVGVEGEPTM
jgi:hypothetical protein